MIPSKSEIGRYIPFYLRDREMTIEEFSKEMEVSTATVYRWIAGKPMFYRYYVLLLSVLREYY